MSQSLELLKKLYVFKILFLNDKLSRDLKNSIKKTKIIKWKK